MSTVATEYVVFNTLNALPHILVQSDMRLRILALNRYNRFRPKP
jgi:hypothetical protein